MESYFNHYSERIEYQALNRNHIPLWEPFFENNDRLHYFGLDLTKTKNQHATEWIERQLNRYNESGLGMLAMIEKSSNTLVGICGIIPRNFEDKTIYEIGYSLLQPYWGKGYASEGAQHMKRVGKELGISNTFVSTIHPDNIDSIKVAERNGMIYLKNGVFEGFDLKIYGDPDAV